MKRILHLFPAYKTGGAPINILRFIKKSKEVVENYTAASKIEDELFEKFAQYTEQCFDVNISEVSISSLLKLIKIIKHINPDVIHVNGKGGAIYGFMLRPFFNGKIFYTFRGFHIKYTGIRQKVYILFENLFSKIYSKAIAVSDSERMFFLKTTGIKGDKVLIIENGVDLDEKELPANIKCVVDKFKFNIVSLSRITEIKDLETMIKAFDLIEEKDIALHIMGGYLSADNEYKEKLQNEIKLLDSRNRIFLWGDIDEAGNVLHNFDIYLSTSLSEGLPTAIIEAGLNGIIVIASMCNGNIDLIKEGTTGYLFPVKDFRGLALKINKTIEEFQSPEQLRIISKNRIQMKGYSVEAHTQKILKLYHQDQV